MTSYPGRRRRITRTSSISTDSTWISRFECGKSRARPIRSSKTSNRLARLGLNRAERSAPLQLARRIRRRATITGFTTRTRTFDLVKSLASLVRNGPSAPDWISTRLPSPATASMRYPPKGTSTRPPVPGPYRSFNSRCRLVSTAEFLPWSRRKVPRRMGISALLPEVESRDPGS